MSDPRLSDLDGFRVEVDPARQRGDIVLDRPPFNVIMMPQRDQLRRAFEALDEDDARARDRAARDRRTFLVRRLHQGLPRGVAGARVQARLEHRRAGALRQAGDRGQSRFLLRRRVRDLARLRFPHRLGDLPIRTAGTTAGPDPGLGRLGAAAADRRHHADQGHRHALAADSGASRRWTGGSPRMCVPMASWKPRPTRWWRNWSASRRWRNAPRRSC